MKVNVKSSVKAVEAKSLVCGATFRLEENSDNIYIKTNCEDYDYIIVNLQYGYFRHLNKEVKVFPCNCEVNEL